MTGYVGHEASQPDLDSRAVFSVLRGRGKQPSFQGRRLMRTLVLSTAIAVLLSLGLQSPTAAQSTHHQARTLGHCLQLAKARGWVRAGEKGRYPFIRKCMEGRVG
jgi:hypothetical protein